VTSREHRLLPHTADTGFEARGPDLAAAFEEAGYALAAMTADIAPEALVELAAEALPPLDDVRLEGRDLPALAFAWLDELVGRIDLDGALAAVEVEAVEERAGAPASGGTQDEAEPAVTWTLRARLATLPFDGARVRRRADVKAATYHGLEVAPDPDGGWRLTAYLDV
jgi:SHS2 domain-containing protein